VVGSMEAAMAPWVRLVDMMNFAGYAAARRSVKDAGRRGRTGTTPRARACTARDERGIVLAQ